MRVSHLASAQTSGVSALYVYPVKTWSQSSFWVNVNLNLSYADSVSGYEVYMSYDPAVLNATGIQWGNLFPRDQVFNASICVNNVGTGCIGGLDNINVVHLNVAALGNAVHGSVSQTLFSVHFSPLGPVGHSVFQFFNDTIWSDAQPPSNLPAPIPHVTWNGIYSNDGLQAFFNVATAIPIGGLPVGFDASSSFNPQHLSDSYNAGLTYSWKFGDGKSGLGVRTSHTYSATGSYPVSLTVNDTLGATSSISRPVVVVSALGTLLIYVTDSAGKTLNQSVIVKLSNSSIVETFTRPGGNTGPVTFSKLKAGSYQVDFSGPRIKSASRQENVQAGWTTTDYVGLTVQTPDPMRSDNLVLYLLLGTMGALPIIGVVLVVRRRVFTRRAKRAARQSG